MKTNHTLTGQAKSALMAVGYFEAMTGEMLGGDSKSGLLFQVVVWDRHFDLEVHHKNVHKCSPVLMLQPGTFKPRATDFIATDIKKAESALIQAVRAAVSESKEP